MGEGVVGIYIYMGVCMGYRGGIIYYIQGCVYRCGWGILYTGVHLGVDGGGVWV